MALWTPADGSLAPRDWIDGGRAVFSGSNLISWPNAGSESGSYTVGGVPTLQTLNGLNGARFATTGQGLNRTLAAWGASGKMFVFAVFRPVTLTVALLANGSVSPNLNANLIATFQDPATQSELIVNGFSASPYLYSDADFSSVGTPYIGSWAVNPNEVRKFGTAASFTTNLSGSVPVYSSRSWSFFKDWTGGVGQVDAFQLLLYDDIPSVGDILRLEGWAAWQYGLQASLPVGHPYASAAPTVGSVGTTAGTSTATAVGSSTVNAIGTAAGTSTAGSSAQADGEPIGLLLALTRSSTIARTGVGSSDGASTVAATSTSTATSASTVAGTSTASATGSSSGTQRAPQVAGTSTAAAVGTSSSQSIGSTAGTSAVEGIATGTIMAFGTVESTSSALAISGAAQSGPWVRINTNPEIWTRTTS